MEDINISPNEIADVMENYKLKKKFHRLKDGTFLSLEANEDVEFLDRLTSGLEVNYRDFKKGVVKLPVSRSLYLNELLKKFKNTKFTKNDEFKEIVNNFEKNNLDEQIKIPKGIDGFLRDYQKLGYRWLSTLDS